MELHPYEITRNFGGEDEVVGVVARHPYVALGFRYLMRDLLQIALAPRDAAEWARCLSAPPTPEEIGAALEPYRSAFVLDDPTSPAMQVRPCNDLLKARSKPARRSRKTAPDDGAGEDEDEDEDAGDAPVAWLLPDAPTKNVTDKDDDFFTKRDPVKAVGAGAILPVLYAHMVLFPPGGGGYFSLPHGGDSLKLAIVGETLWASIFANVLPRDMAPYSGAVGRVPCNETVFPWLDPSLAGMSLTKGDDGGENRPGSRRVVKRANLHPCAIPMPRRYLLKAARDAVCDLTGVAGPVFDGYARWPNGLQYDAKSWWAPFAATEETYAWNGSGYAPKPRKPKAGDDPAEEARPAFVKAAGPLRFDHWLGLSLMNGSPIPNRKIKETWSRREIPPVLAAFQAAERHIARAPANADTMEGLLARRSAFRLEAIAAVPAGKVLGLLDARSLPLWLARDDVARNVAASIEQMLAALSDIGGVLQTHAKGAALVTDPKRSPAIAAQLRDALLTAQDGALSDAAQAVFGAYAATAELDEADRDAGALVGCFVKDTKRTALDLFDVTFPILDAGAAATRIAVARAKLNKSLGKIAEKSTPMANETAGPAKRKGRGT